MPTVKTPDGKTVRFPDNMNMDEIQGILDTEYPKTAEAPIEQKGQSVGRYAWENIGKPTVELGAMTAGAVAGSAAGPVGTVVGAGLAYAQGKALTNIIDTMISKYAREPIQEDSVKGSMIRSLGDVRDGMMMEMGGQLAGKVVVDPLQKLLAPAANKMTAAAIAFRQQAKNQGITLSPGEVTGSKVQLLGESMMSNSPASADVVKNFSLKNQIEPILQKRRELMESTAANPKDIEATGRQIYKEVNDYLVKREGLQGKALEEMRSRVIGELGSNDSRLMAGLTANERILAESQRRVTLKNELYDKATDAIKELDKGAADYALPSMKSTAEELLSQYKKLPDTALPSETRNWLNWAAGKDKMNPIIKKRLEGLPPDLHDEVIATMKKANPELFPEKLDLESLTFARQELNRLIEANNPAFQKGVGGFKGQTNTEGYIYGQLKTAVNNDWRNIIESNGGEAKKLLDIADAFYSTNIKEGVRSDIIKRTAYADPEKIIDLVFKKGGITEVNTVRKFLGDSNFQDLRAQFTNKLMGTDKGKFDPTTLQTQLRQYGDEFLQNIYRPDELRFLRDTAKRGLDLATLKLPGDAFVRTLANKNPEVLVDAIIGTPESKIQSTTLYNNVLNIRKVVSPDTFKNIGDQLIEKIFQVNPSTKYLPPETFARVVNKYTGASDYGRNVLDAFGFPKEKITQLSELADTAGRMSVAQKVAANPSGTAQNVITWGSLGMILRDPIRGIPIVIAPEYMAKLWYSPKGMKWLTDGFKLPVASKDGVATATKLIGIINSDSVSDMQNNLSGE